MKCNRWVILGLCLFAVTWSSTSDADLYAVDGANQSGGSPSTLYRLDSNTGAVIQTIGPVGFDAVKGIAINPLSGVMFGVVSNGATGENLLITIDHTTGAGVLVGPTGNNISDLTFDAAGVLFGWSESTDDLVIINLETGISTVVGTSGLPTGSTGLEVDGAGRLLLKNFEPTLYQMNPGTGVPTPLANLVPPPSGNRYRNVLAYNPNNGVMYTAEKDVDPPPIYTFDPLNGSDPIPTTLIGTGPSNLTAMTFGYPISINGVVYDNGSTNPAIDTGNEMSAWVHADDFELASPVTVSGVFVEWIESIQGVWDGQIQWYIFADNAGAPGTLLYQGNGIDTSTVQFADNNGWYWYRTDVEFDSGVALAAGTRYWIGLHWSAPGDFNIDGVYWATTQVGGFNTTGHESVGGTFDNWLDNSFHRAFKLLAREPCGLFCDGFESGDTTEWSNTVGYLPPNYDVDDGPLWGTNPPVYSCLDACALLFGGVAGDYQCSTSSEAIDHLANASTYAVGGCQIVAEEYKLDQGGGYDCGFEGCSTSAYVSDNCIGGTNYCWPQ